MLRRFIFLFILCCSILVSAQDSTALKKFRILSVGACGSTMRFYDATTQQHDLEVLAPQMTLLREDKTNFSADASSRGRSSAIVFGAGIEFGKSLQSNGKPAYTRFSCGLGTQYLELNFLSFHRLQAIPFDTVTADNGDVIFLDSLIEQQYNFSMHMRVAALEFAQRFYLSVKHLPTLFAGYALQGAFAYHAGVNGDYTERTRRIALNVPLPQDYAFDAMRFGYAEDNVSRRDETAKLHNFLLYRISIPAGVEFSGKLAKRSGAVMLRVEERFGAEFLPVHGVRTYTRSFLSTGMQFCYYFPGRKCHSE